MQSTKEHILGCVEDLVANFLYYDRKEDEELPRGTIESMIKGGSISVEDIVNQFEESLINGIE